MNWGHFACSAPAEGIVRDKVPADSSPKNMTVACFEQCCLVHWSVWIVREEVVGIDVGVTQVTFSNGETAPVNHEVPRDLLIRVADNVPYVDLANDALTIRPSHEIYASAVACALSGRPADPRDEFRAALAVPGWWPPQTQSRVRQALSDLDVDITLVNDAEAAVVEYQALGNALSSTVAVVSLRSQQVSVVVVKNCSEKPLAMASPILVHEEGGYELDVAVLQHIMRGVTDLRQFDSHVDPILVSSVPSSLKHCHEMREALSVSTTESMTLRLADGEHRIRIVRGELEEISTPWADALVGIVRSALEHSALQVEAVLLTGGVAHMPLVSQRLSADLGLEIHVPDDPELIVAQGAERVMASQYLQPKVLESDSEEQSPSEPRWRIFRSPFNRRQKKERPFTSQTTSDTQYADHIETLLDSEAADNSATITDASWIPSSPKFESLVRQV